MSGDVQPRKRRDKKKKKDDFEETTAHHFHARAPTPSNSNDEVIHVYKENSTGGGICAKIVFFCLLSILAVLIGLIITEHRGLTDLDTIETETRFSQIFEGWIDTTPESHDDDAHHALEHGDHDDEHDDDHDDEDAHDDDEDEEHASEEEEEEEEEDEEHASEEEEQEESALEEEEEEEEQSVQQDDDEEEEEEEEEEAAASEEPSAQQDEEDEEEEEEDEEKSAAASEDAQDDDDDDEEAEKPDDGDDDEQEADDDEADADSKAAADEDDQSAQAASEEKDDDDNDDNDDEEEAGKSQEENDGDDDDDDEENAEAGDDEQPGDEGENNDETNAGVVIKIGVGVTILVVAYVVLVRKWKSDNDQGDSAEKKEVPVDLSRRNTIVVPPKVEEIEQVIDDDDEEYSEEEEEIRKQDYQQLRSTYERSLTPESDPETQGRSYDYEDEAEDDVEYDDEEGEYEENLGDGEEGEDEEGEEEEEPISDPDDDDLLKKIEAKYGKLEASQGDEEEEEDEEEEDEEEEEHDYPWKRGTGGEQSLPSEDELNMNFDTPTPYEHESITNDEDITIKDQLDVAHEHIETNAALALSLFNNILKKHPTSPRATYGKAKSFDNLADKQRSNELLKEAILTYTNLFQLSGVPPKLFAMAGERCVNRMRFIGQYGRAAATQHMLISKFPNEITYRNQLAVTYLMSNRIGEARNILQETLQRWPNDGFALVHYGFILKVNDNKLKESVDYLERGLATKASGVIDGRFYFHLGDAFIRLGKKEKAAKIYNEGVENNVFLSFYQRSLYNVDRLKGKPWWEKHEIPKYKQFVDMLEKNYKAIRKEGLALLNDRGYFQDEAENLRDVGEWKQFELYARGSKKAENCKKCPVTCKLIETLPDATGCRRGQIKFSMMHPGTHVWPHCGPTNCRLRVHLGLKVPKNTFIRVAEEIRSWEEGKVLIFDDSFEHEVWHNGTETRLVLIVDVWHPELTRIEKQSLSAI